MNKKSLISQIQHDADASLTQEEISTVLVVLSAIVRKELSEGESVILPGIGTLHRRTRPARKGRNPQTGQSIEISAKNVIDFRPTKALKDAINED